MPQPFLSDIVQCHLVVEIFLKYPRPRTMPRTYRIRGFDTRNLCRFLYVYFCTVYIRNTNVQ